MTTESTNVNDLAAEGQVKTPRVISLKAKNTTSETVRANIFSQVLTDGVEYSCHFDTTSQGSYVDLLIELKQGERKPFILEEYKMEFENIADMEPEFLESTQRKVENSERTYVEPRYPILGVSAFQFMERLSSIKADGELLNDKEFSVELAPGSSVIMTFIEKVDVPMKLVFPADTDFPENVFPLWMENTSDKKMTFEFRTWVEQLDLPAGFVFDGGSKYPSFTHFMTDVIARNKGKLRFHRFYFRTDEQFSDPLMNKLKEVLDEQQKEELFRRISYPTKTQLDNRTILWRYVDNNTVNRNSFYMRPNGNQYNTRIMNLPEWYALDLMKSKSGTHSSYGESLEFSINPHTRICFFVSFEEEQSQPEA